MRPSDKLALSGGAPAIDKSLAKPIWPETLPQDEAAVVEALSKNDLTSLYAGGAVEMLEAAWSKWIGTKHCIAVSNGTSALKLALAALDIGPGDEVIVPALSFIASAIAPLHVGAQPVFADIDPRSFNLDPKVLPALLTSRTKAIIVVHLHGLPADMSEILQFARQNSLHVIEDAAQAHGATYQDKHVGTLSEIGVFSLNASKNLPTCGEGGLITTDNDTLADRLQKLRQFGERLKRGERRFYLHEDIGWNNKLGGVPAAYTLSQLDRFGTSNTLRDSTVRKFLDRLRGLPGLIVPETLPDRSHVWHILRFLVDAEDAGFPHLTDKAFRLATQRALRAEGVPVEPYQQHPLPAQPIFAKEDRTAMCRLGRELPVKPFYSDSYPITSRVIDNSFTLQRVHLNSGADAFLQACAEGFNKVFGGHRDQVARIAQSIAARTA